MSDKTLQLIEIVKKYSILYDPSHENHKNSKIKNKIWDCIAEQVQEKDGDTVKAKWKNLRDSYAKHLRALYPQTGHASKLIERYKTWPWVKQMAFLEPFLEYSVTQTNMSVLSKEFENNTDQFTKTFEQSGPSYHDILGQEHYSSSQHSHHKQRRHREPQHDAVMSHYNDMKEYDETDLIFLGYSKTIKKMSLRRQALIKFNIAKIIMKAEIEHIDETSSYDNVNRSSPSFNSAIDRNKSPQECYSFVSNCVEESGEFPDPTEAKVEIKEYSHISSALDPLSVVSTHSFTQRNYHSHQKSIPTTISEDTHITCSHSQSSFINPHENKIDFSGKK